jgi:hypothetical protein
LSSDKENKNTKEEATEAPAVKSPVAEQSELKTVEI